MIKNKKIWSLFILFFALIVFVKAFSRTNNIANGKTVIQFASWGSQSEVEIIKPILNEFEKENPDIKVDFLHIPENYFQKIHLLFASNLAPDVLFLNNLYLPIYANAGVLEPLDGISSSQIDSSDFFDKSIDALSYKEHMFAVPRDISNLVIYYNKDLFKEFGVPCPSKYWNFEDFLTLAQKMTRDTDGDGKIDTWGISFEDEPALYFLPYLMSEGGGILSDDSLKLIIDSEESQKGLNFYADLRNKYHVAPTQAESASETMAQMFLQGKLAMQLSGRWLVPKYKTAAKFDWNVVSFPIGDKGSIVPLDASGWAIAKSSKHNNEAIRLIQFLSSKGSIEKFTQSGLIVPARKDVAKGDFLQTKNSPPNNKVFVDIIKTSKPTPVSVNYSEILDNLKEETNILFNSNSY